MGCAQREPGEGLDMPVRAQSPEEEEGMNRREWCWRMIVCAIAAGLSMSVLADPAGAGNPAAQEAEKSEKENRKEKAKEKKRARPEGEKVMWEEPADIGARNLLLGPGGEAMKPDLGRITLLEEEKGGFSTKYRVRDAAGRVWVAKVGKEAQSEIAASRLLWSAGYFVEVTYLAPRVEIEGKGSFENVRFEARPENAERLGEWRWDDNPFTGTRELQGLKVMMMLLNNWDIKDANNIILLERDEKTGVKRTLYLISDLGSTFGKTSRIVTGTRNEPGHYARSKFIEEIDDGKVDFFYGGKRADLFTDITVEQALWIGNLLARLSDEQIRDAFRAANYSQGEIVMLATAVRERINQLLSLNEALGRRETL